MRLPAIIRILGVSILVALVACSSNASDARDGFVYVVALEKTSPDESCSMWNPTMYKISVKNGIVKCMKIADQGAPICCESVENTNIRLVLHEGIFANGTSVGEPITREIIVNKNTMAVVKSKIVQRIELKSSVEFLLEQPLKSRQEFTPIARTLPDKETFLVDCPTSSRVLTLSDYSKKESLSVTIRDQSSLREIEAIRLNMGDRKLGGFSGTVNTALVGDQFLICLFEGESAIGKFAPAYVMIVDIATKIVKWVSIGSNPALGIIYPTKRSSQRRDRHHTSP